MKKLIASACFAMMALVVWGQQQQGRIVYERTIEMQIRFAGNGGDDIGQLLPRTRTDKVEVLFANNQSLRRILQDEVPDEGNFSGNGMQIRVMTAGADDVIYHHFGEQRTVEQREFATKKYLISDSIQQLNWKLTGETKEVLGYLCQQAIAQRITKRMAMTVDNGVMKREEVPDTLNITAWFAPAIPVSAGPEYQGQLPGLIMALDINNGRQVYRAVEFKPEVDIKAIKEPKNGKKVTAEEFRKEREKMMQEMERNGGGRMRFRMG